MSSVPPVSLCMIGYHDPESPRLWVITKGLEAHGVKVLDGHTEARGFFGKYMDLFRKGYTAKTDVLFIAQPGQYLLPLAWILGKIKGIPVVFDAFISLYDSMVHDRALVKPASVYSSFLWCIDWMSCRLADILVMDTPEHAEYFIKTFGASARKIMVLPIGCRTDIFTPGEKPSSHPIFQVVFHGSFIPLQGVDTILEAAALLQKDHHAVHFSLIGKGQTWKSMKEKADALSLTNTEFLGIKSMADIADIVRRADAGLGIFGTTDKADRVMPHKAYEILASGCPLLTGDTAAARSVLTHGQTALLSPPGDAAALAANILRLMQEEPLRNRLREGANTLTLARFQSSTIVEPLLEYLQVLWQKKSSSQA